MLTDAATRIMDHRRPYSAMYITEISVAGYFYSQFSNCGGMDMWSKGDADWLVMNIWRKGDADWLVMNIWRKGDADWVQSRTLGARVKPRTTAKKNGCRAESRDIQDHMNDSADFWTTTSHINNTIWT